MTKKKTKKHTQTLIPGSEPAPDCPKERTTVSPGDTFSITLTLACKPPRYSAVARGVEVETDPEIVWDEAFWKRVLQPTRERVGSKDPELVVLAVNQVDKVGGEG
jgi:hypothetical protein